MQGGTADEGQGGLNMNPMLGPPPTGALERSLMLHAPVLSTSDAVGEADMSQSGPPGLVTTNRLLTSQQTPSFQIDDVSDPSTTDMRAPGHKAAPDYRAPTAFQMESREATGSGDGGGGGGGGEGFEDTPAYQALSQAGILCTDYRRENVEVI